VRARRSRLVAGATYSGDNGRLFCRDHAGASAKFTGRDLSGQRVARLSPADEKAIREACEIPEERPLCEGCSAKFGARS